MKSLGLESYAELCYSPSLAQTCVYNLTYLKTTSKKCSNSHDTYSLLFANFCPVSEPCADKQYFTFQHFDTESNFIKPVTKLIDFPYLPGGSNIVCINALRDDVTSEFFVAIGFVKDKQKGYLNIYCSRSQERLPERCLSYSELSSVPLHLNHTCYFTSNLQYQWAFILSCDPLVDQSNSSPLSSHTHPEIRIFTRLTDVNVYNPGSNLNENEEKYENNFSVKQQLVNGTSCSSYGELNFTTSSIFFPELLQLPAVIFLHMEFMILKYDSLSPIRLSAFGSSTGWFSLFSVDLKSCVVLQNFTFSHETPITNLKLFQQSHTVKSNTQMYTNKNDSKQQSLAHLKSINLLVCTAFEPSVVYCDIFEKNGFHLSNQLILPHSTEYDHVNCATIGDFNLDGQLEIILGTFGQYLLYYEYEMGYYRLKSQRLMIGPIYSLSPPLDLMGSGLCCLVVSTSRGLHVLQHHLPTILDVLDNRLNSYISSQQ